MSTVVARHTFRTLAELWDRLGNVPLDRIRMDPRPGTATRADMTRLARRSGGKVLCELVAGTLVEKAVGNSESILAIWLGGFVCEYLTSNPIGQITGPDGGYETVEDQLRQPDFAFTRSERIREARVEESAFWAISPDLAVEVISPGNTAREMDAKLVEYFAAGVRLVWYVDPRQRTVRVFTSPDDVRELTENDILDGGDVLPGFELSIREWFQRAEVKR
jgi:Uma2 family endonuclease